MGPPPTYCRGVLGEQKPIVTFNLSAKMEPWNAAPRQLAWQLGLGQKVKTELDLEVLKTAIRAEEARLHLFVESPT